jgi:4-carboxymuconolactone decarboxylase
MTNERYETGLGIRREVLGDRYVDNALRNVDAYTDDFQRLVTEYCWGASWGRDGLSRRQRSLNVLCLIAALNRPHEFEIHFRGALRNGCTVDELRETLIQIAIYAGIPAGVEAFRIGRKVLAEAAAEPAE